MNIPNRKRRLGSILVERQVIDPDSIGRYPEAISDSNLATRLLEDHCLSEEQLAQGLAELFRLDYIDPREVNIDQALFSILPASQAYELGVVPLARNGDGLRVAVADPFDLTLVDRLERISGMPVQPVLSTAKAIRSSLKLSEGVVAALKDVAQDFRMVLVRETESGEQEMVDIGDERSPVVRLINSILRAAMHKRASDVHVEVYEHGIAVKYRIDGVLSPATDILDPRHHGALISRLKVMAELDIAEKRLPQDGRFTLHLNGANIDFRVSILPGVHGEDVVIRILDKSSITDDLNSLSLDALGMAPTTLRRFRKAIREPYGMVLITGPTGSGKTTTLYAALSELISGEEKIITIEDPVEYQLDGIVQVPVNEKKQFTFAKGLRSILRHDPDKIMVGEIRDNETAKIAVQSALTGHLVFTTVHANNAFDVISRFSHMGIDAYSFVSALNCVMAQRLIRKICPDCRQQATISDELLERSGLCIKQYRDNVWYEGKSCSKCNGTGYRNRMAVTELLVLSTRIRDMMIRQCPISELQAAAREDGMTTLRESALRMAVDGVTSLQEINRVTFVD